MTKLIRMHIYYSIVSLLFCLFSFQNGFSQSEVNVPIDSIKFELLEDNRIYTYCTVNGSDSLLFLFDTGASDMVINSERSGKVKIEFNSTEENLGTTGTNKIPSSSNNLLKWGRQTIENTKFISIPYPYERWDGVLGLSVLTRYAVKIDYDKKLIFLFDRSKYTNKSDNKVKMHFLYNIPFVKINVTTADGVTRKLNMALDTGSDRIIDISTSYTNENKLQPGYKDVFAISKISSSDGGSGTIYNVYFPKIKFSNYEFYKIPGGIAQIPFGLISYGNVDGMIGNGFLKRFNVILDFQSNYLIIEPNNYLYTSFYPFLTK